MANEFLNFYRNTFMGQKDQVNAEKKAAQAEAKAAKASADAEKAQSEAKKKEDLNNFLNNLRKTFQNTLNEGVARIEKAPETLKEVEKIEFDPTDNGNIVEYTYKSGDTFGQIIKDLGLGTDAGLWGADGDVAYYTKQLADQGIIDSRGNIPVGAKIKLRRRGAPETTVSESVEINTPEVTQKAILPRQTVTNKSSRLI